MAIRTDQDALLNAIGTHTREAVSPSSTIYITGTKKFTGPFYAISALTTSTIDVSECDINMTESDGSGAMQAITTNLVLPAGQTIFGEFASIELDSGTAIGYVKKGITITVEV